MGKIFQAFYDCFMFPLERTGFKTIRREIIAKASGMVLEIGSGTGVNFPLYRDVRQVVAVEPNQLMRQQSLGKRDKSCVPIEVIEASAEILPFPDGYFDSVVATLVFCTIPNPERALEEVKRVSKPDANILFFEHVRINDRPLLGKLQDVLSPTWRRLCDGCHLNRDTVSLIEKAGFRINKIGKFYKNIFVTIEATNSAEQSQAD